MRLIDVEACDLDVAMRRAGCMPNLRVRDRGSILFAEERDVAFRLDLAPLLLLGECDARVRVHIGGGVVRREGVGERLQRQRCERRGILGRSDADDHRTYATYRASLATTRI